MYIHVCLFKCMYTCVCLSRICTCRFSNVCTRDTYHVRSCAFFCPRCWEPPAALKAISLRAPPIFFEHNYSPVMFRWIGWRGSSVCQKCGGCSLAFSFLLIKAPSGRPLLAERRKTNKIETLPSNRHRSTFELRTNDPRRYHNFSQKSLLRISTPYDAWLHGLGKHHITGTNTSPSLGNAEHHKSNKNKASSSGTGL